MERRDDLEACAALVAKGDADRFAALRAAPVAARKLLMPLYAFNVEVSRAPWVTGEAMIAEMRLQWWRDALAEIGGTGAVRSHEVTVPLSLVLRGAEVDVSKLDALVAVRRWDIYRDAFEDDAHLKEYLRCSGGHLMGAAAAILGGDGAAQAAAEDYGTAAALAAWFRAIPALEAAGRRPLVDGRAEAVHELALWGQGLLRAARAARRDVPKAVAPALWAGWRADQTLKLAARVPRLVQEGGLEVSPARKQLGLIWASMAGRW
ncbi:squalene/phytoene synthase family protein [Alphaproteobacteria bacterium KMM 3653]|uniref:Squalene/phytoene synthase family protein n=1 Tax=Harenicola maris TaxID=2841044 RepID=A0AAP2G781_9RHOB|nr:squalene/phytoene synthase family protein [Harenicola maris]